MRTAKYRLLYLLLAFLGAATACIEDRNVDVVLTGEFVVDLHHDQNDVTAEIPVVVGVPGVLADILADEGYSLDDIESVGIAGAAYGTAALEGDHDWIIGGEVDVQRVDGVVAGPREALLEYTEQSVEAALGQRIVAPLQSAGVGVVNGALQDYVSGGTPMLEFRIRNQDTTPPPSVLDPMVFDWKLWVELTIVINVRARVPDPF